MRNNIAKLVKKVFVFIGLLAIPFCFSFNHVETAFADVTLSSGEIEERMMYQNVYKCYTNGSVKSSFNPISSLNSMKDFVSDGAGDIMPLVTELRNGNFSINDNKINCYEVFNGYSSLTQGKSKGVFTITGHSPVFGRTSNPSEMIEFLKNMGYGVIEGESCPRVPFTFEATNGDSGSSYTNQVCGEGESLRVTTNVSHSPNFVIDEGRLCMDWKDVSYSHRIQQYSCVEISSGTSTIDLMNKVIDNMCTTGKGSRERCSIHYLEGEAMVASFDYPKKTDSNSAVSLDDSSATFISHSSAQKAAKQAISFLSNGKYSGDVNSITFKDTDLSKRLLYQDYLEDYYGVTIKCDESYTGEGFTGQIKWFNSATKKVEDCYYDRGTSGDKANLSANGVGENGFLALNSIANLDDLLKKMESLATSYSQEEVDEAAAASSTTGATESQLDCMGLDLNGQGWELCPMLMNGANTADGFVFAIDEMLNVKTNLYDQESDTFKAWNVFRTFANVAMSLVLLVIIISQVTGFGINNYGIKKMLPRFVVVAILVNLSFVLCEVAVDVSNILGKGLDDLFRNLAGSFGSPTVGSGNTISDLVAGLIALLGGGGAVAALVPGVAIAAEVAAPLLIISLVLSVLVALVGILLFFVMLGARMVIVVGFIAIAPVAIVCYILPNTQVLFKKWWSIFKAALVMYPLCGLLYGLSFVIKAIFNGSGTPGLWEGVVLLITPFLPFFVLPGLLKGALAGLGAVGGALTSLGNGLKSGLQNANSVIKNSEGYKQASQFAQDQKAAKWAERVASKYNSDKYKNRELSNRQKAERLAAINIGNAQRMKEATADVGAYELSPDTANLRAQSAKSAQELRAYSDQFTQMSYGQLSDEAKNIGAWIGDDDAESHMNALLQQLTARGALTETYEMLEKAGGRTKSFGTVMGSLAGSGDAVLKAYGKGGSDYADFKSFMNEGGFQKYAGNKGLGLSGIDDDKTLSYLASVEGTSNMQQLSTEQLVNVAATTNDQVAIDQIDKMLEKRTDFSISGDQLTRLNSSTIETLGQSEAGKRALSKAMEAVVNDPQLSGKLSDKLKKDIQNSIGYLPTAQSGNASGSNNLPHGFEQTDSGLVIPRNK